MKKVARVFETSTGKYHYCEDNLSSLDARGKGFDTKRQAMEAAYMAGFTHAVGSVTYRQDVSTILSQVPQAIEFQREHEWAHAEEAFYRKPAQEG